MRELLIIALVLAVLGSLILVIASRLRFARGLSEGKTFSLDNVTLYSERYQLVGRPDRLVREKGSNVVIPEEWKSSKRVYHGHKLQLATYFILIEDEFGERPPYGFVVLGDGSRVEVANTEELRSEVLSIAERIRERRARLLEVILVNQPTWKCRACGQRQNCSQATVKTD